MREKTYKFVHILYVLLITNIVSAMYLFIGLFSFSVIPVISANINISLLLFDGKIDGYSGIWGIFNEYVKVSIKEKKNSILLFGAYCLMLLVSILFMKRANSPVATTLNYLFIYLYIMIVVFWSYYSLLNIVTKNNFKYIDGLALMFLNPKKLVITIGTCVILLILGLIRKEMLVIIFISIYSAIFVKTNRSIVNSIAINK